MKQYIDKAALVAEIERRRQELRPTNTHQMKVDEKMDRDVLMWLNALAWVKKLLDTLEAKEVQEEPVSDGLEEAAKNVGQKYFPDGDNIWARPNYEAVKAECAFMDGAQWQKEKACEWLKENKDHPLIGCEDPCLSGYLTDGFIEDFKKAMEE